MSERARDTLNFAAHVTSDGRRIKGAVKLAGARTQRNGEWVEVDPAALVKADAKTAVARFNHDPSKVLADMRNGTLQINRTEDGIEFETTELPNVSYANDALELVRGGYVRGSSFEIEGIRSRFDTAEDGSRVRRIISIRRLVDVSPVFDPAFTSTAAAFSKEQGMDDEQETKEPVKAPEPVVKFAEKPRTEIEEWIATGETFSTEALEAQMDAIFESTKGQFGPKLAQYEGFAKVLESRRREDAAAAARIDNLRSLHAARLGKLVKAPEAGLLASDDYLHAFSAYLKTGDRRGMEQFAQSIGGTGAEGGYTVPDGFRQKIVETQAAYGGIQQHADIVETGDGRALPYPTNNDTANSAVVASEGAAPASAGADLVFGQISLGAFSIAATGASNAPLKVSWELLQDSAFDIEGFVARKLGERLGRKAAAYYATGVGTTEPFGLLAKTPDTMTATTALAAFIEHTFQVNEAYRSAGNCRWIMSDTVLSIAYNSVDGNGRPLFIPEAQSSGAGRPAGTVIGYPVQLDQGAGSLVAFGDIAQGFVIRRVRGIEVVVDPYNNTATRQNAYHAWMRTDSAIQDSAAVSVSSYSGVSADS